MTIPTTPSSVWIVSLEWNEPPSEVTGDTGIVQVFDNEEDARACRLEQQKQFHDQGMQVYEYSQLPGRYCGLCGEDAHEGDCVDGYADLEFCDHCGAELNDRDECDNDHDDWSIDVHCTEHQIHPPRPIAELAAVLAIAEEPLNRWPAHAENSDTDTRRLIADRAGDLAVRLARLAGYFNRRYLAAGPDGHDRAVADQNRIAKALRAALGFTYPSNDIHF